MASCMHLKESVACINVVKVIEEHCDYETLIEFQDVLTSEVKVYDIVNWLGEVIDRKREGTVNNGSNKT